MALKILTPPAGDGLPVTIADARDHLKIDGNLEDAILSREIRAVMAWLAGPQGWLGRSILSQRLRLTVPLGLHDGFTGPEIGGAADMTGVVLPRPPVIEVESVAVVDARGGTTLVDVAGYTVSDGPDGLTRVLFTDLHRWPVVAAGPAQLAVTYRAGYGATAAEVDAGLAHAILMTVARLHTSRGDPTSTLADDPMIARLFAPYTVMTRS